MVFNAPFNNISALLWQSVLLMEETEKTTDLSHVTEKLDHIMLTPCPDQDSNLQHHAVGSCKSHYHTF